MPKKARSRISQRGGVHGARQKGGTRNISDAHARERREEAGTSKHTPLGTRLEDAFNAAAGAPAAPDPEEAAAAAACRERHRAAQRRYKERKKAAREAEREGLLEQQRELATITIADEEDRVKPKSIARRAQRQRAKLRVVLSEFAEDWGAVALHDALQQVTVEGDLAELLRQEGYNASGKTSAMDKLIVDNIKAAIAEFRGRSDDDSQRALKLLLQLVQSEDTPARNLRKRRRAAMAAAAAAGAPVPDSPARPRRYGISPVLLARRLEVAASTLCRHAKAAREERRERLKNVIQRRAWVDMTKRRGHVKAMNCARDEKAKTEERSCHVYDEVAVSTFRDHQGNHATINPSTAAERAGKLSHSTFKSFHHLRVTAAGEVYLRRWPCGCAACARELRQDRFATPPDCALTPIAGDLNDWRRVELRPAKQGEDGIDETEEDLDFLAERLVNKTERRVALIEPGHNGAIPRPDDDPEYPYYLVKFISVPYELVEPLSVTDWGPIEAGKQVIDFIYYSRSFPLANKGVRHLYDRNWHSLGDLQLTMPADLVLHSSFDMPPAQAHAKDAKAPGSHVQKALKSKPVVLDDFDHRIIMDELAQRDNVMGPDDDDDDDGQGAEGTVYGEEDESGEDEAGHGIIDDDDD